MSRALREHFLVGRKPLVVAGTHGKTTTSAMCAHVFAKSGRDPGWFIGGVPRDLPAGAAIGSTKRKLLADGAERAPFVVEGDEYDDVHWSKRPKFLDYIGIGKDDVAIVTSVEQDHIDVYPDVAAYEEAFRAFVRAVPEEGLVVVDAHAARARAIAQEEARARVVFYALEGDETGDVTPTWLGAPASFDPFGNAQFDLFAGGISCGRYTLRVPGAHNIRNAVATIAACAEGFGEDVRGMRAPLAAFEGVKRRQELLGTPGGVRVYDDFAHHPDRGRGDALGPSRAPPGREAVGHLRAAERDGVPRAPPARVRARVRGGGPGDLRAARADEHSGGGAARSRAPDAGDRRAEGRGAAVGGRDRGGGRGGGAGGRHDRGALERGVRGGARAARRGARRPPRPPGPAPRWRRWRRGGSVSESPLASPGARAEIIAVALAAAREAAAFVHSAWRKHPRAEQKGKGDSTEIVTRFDRESERLLRDRLTRGTPFAVVGEEGGGDRAAGADEATWFVDPIDGTTNFVHGHPFYCVSLGLVVGVLPVLGVVVAPSLGVEWTGSVGDGAQRSGEACRVSDVDAIASALLATGFPYDRATSEDNNFDAFVAIKKKCQAVRRCGSAALDLCLVADGTYDGYWETKLAPWDCAAGAALVVAAGGRISNYAGGSADVIAGQLLATNGAIHDALVGELQKVPTSHLKPVPRYRR